jgi:phospholipid/cholesterol/gamma-HCH transport system substrate-binding protein
MNQSGPDIVQLLNSARSIADNLKNNNGRLSQVIANFEQISDTLKRANVGATILKVNQAVTGLNQVVNDINEGKGSIGALIKSDALHNKLTDAAQSLDVLIDDIQKNPKRYLSFSVVGRKESEGFSKKELEEIRKEINNINLDKKKP